MEAKKDVVFCFRLDYLSDRIIRDIASRSGVSASSYVRKILRSWLVSRGLLSRGGVK